MHGLFEVLLVNRGGGGLAPKLGLTVFINSEHGTCSCSQDNYLLLEANTLALKSIIVLILYGNSEMGAHV